MIPLLNQSDLVSRLLSINWGLILSTAFQLLFFYFFIILFLIPIICYITNKSREEISKNDRIYWLTIPLSIVTAMLFVMTVEQLQFFGLIASLGIIFQIFYRLLQ